MSNVKLFESKKIRSAWNADEEKWYFSVQDVVEILTDSADIKQYIKKLRNRDPELFTNWGTICTLVEMTAADGKRAENTSIQYGRAVQNYPINSISQSTPQELVSYGD